MPDPDENQTVVLGGAAARQSDPPAAAAASASQNALPVGTRLGEFEIVGLVGEGGFGIVYLAQDHSLERKVALKEYMPSSLASRTLDASVAARSERHRETFEVGRRSFVNEARLLAQFDHPALVKVYRFWEANGTAYMAMPFYDGITLRDALKALGTAPDEAWIRKIVFPVMEALEIIHAQNCFHRDIAPDNIMLMRDGRPVLLDFGAARRVIGDMTQALTVILKPGYAPIEQYAEMPGMKQGAWTDIYALGAVVYFMITGRTPPPSVGRMMQDSYEPLARIAAGRYGAGFLEGIDRCLAVRAEDRPQSIAAMRELLRVAGEPTRPGTTPDLPAGTAATAPATPDRSGHPGPSVAAGEATLIAAPAGKGRGLLIGGVAGVVLAAVAGGYFLLGRSGPAPVPDRGQAPVVASSTPLGAASAAGGKPASGPPVPLADALRSLLAGSGAEFGVRATDVKDVLVAGHDPLSFSLVSQRDGFAYLLVWDHGAGTVSQLFPNARDRENRVLAGQPLRFPLRPDATSVALPTGEMELIAIVSESPREFDRLGLAAGQAAQSDVEAALGRNGIDALAGSPHCAGGVSCPPAYGATRFRVTKRNPPAEPAAGKDAVAAGATTQGDSGTASARDKAAPGKPVIERPRTDKPPRGKPAGKDSQTKEQEYMKKLNRDLDKLLDGSSR